MTEEKLNFILIERAARLIYLGLEGKKGLSGNEEFNELFRSYRTDSKFVFAVQAIATGIHLDILDIDHSGIYLRPHRGSIFAKTRTQIRKLTEKGQDRYTGIILVALAAYYFPKDSAFDEESVHSTLPITIGGLDLFIREKCRKIKEREKPPDRPAGDETMEILLTSFLNLPTESQIESTRRVTSPAYIKKTLKSLAEEGLFIEKKNKFWPTAKFRHQMQSMAENEYVKSFIESIKGGNS